MNSPDKPAPTNSAENAGIEQGRRRLLRGALGASPILVTLASRPVLAAACTTPSGFISGVSGVRGTQPICSGQTAAFWASNPDAWPAPYVSGNASSLHLAALGPARQLVTPATKFHDVFVGNQFGGKPLSEVLQMPDGGMTGLAKYCSAALLNAAAGRTPVLSQRAVQSMWSSYVNIGYYQPTAGIRWYASEIVQYLRSTMQ